MSAIWLGSGMGFHIIWMQQVNKDFHPGWLTFHSSAWWTNVISKHSDIFAFCLCSIHKHKLSNFFPVFLKAAPEGGVQVDLASSALRDTVFWPVLPDFQLGKPLETECGGAQRQAARLPGSSHRITEARTQAEEQEGSQNLLVIYQNSFNSSKQ